MKYFLFILLSLAAFSCSQVSVIKDKKQDRAKLYNQNFLKKIGEVKNLFKSGNIELALERISFFDDNSLNDSELALKYNLRGVIHFSQDSYDEALVSFQKASETSKADTLLNSQVLLNLASTHYKLQDLESSFGVLQSIDVEPYNQKEKRKYYHLILSVSKSLGNQEVALESLVGLIGSYDTFQEMKQDPSFGELDLTYRNSSDELRERVRSDESNSKLARGYLLYLESRLAESLGERDQAELYREMIKDDFSEYPEIIALVEGVEESIKISSQIEPYTVGVVLPLSGNRSSYGQRALMGIDSVLRIGGLGEEASKVKILIRDSKSDPLIGAVKTQELIEKHSVALIIGGLFADEAEKQFLETRKRGAFFISLSQVDVLSELKNDLLLEIPGSIQSQLSMLFSSKALAQLGTRGAILYPNSARGQVYLDEFWRQSQAAGVNINNVMDYPIGKGVDYRKPVKKLLGLNFPRERKEELELLKEVYELEDRSIRRIQTLPPIQDFDWVFIPARPLEAVQIIPSFAYYDAFKASIIGDSTWRSKRVSNLSYRSKKLYFLGDNIELKATNLNQLFFEKYQKPFRVIEMRGFDSLKLAATLLAQGDYESRSEFNDLIRKVGELKGLSSLWSFENGFWIKEMNVLRFRNGKIREAL